MSLHTQKTKSPTHLSFTHVQVYSGLGIFRMVPNWMTVSWIPVSQSDWNTFRHRCDVMRRGYDFRQKNELRLVLILSSENVMQVYEWSFSERWVGHQTLTSAACIPEDQQEKIGVYVCTTVPTCSMSTHQTPVYLIIPGEFLIILQFVQYYISKIDWPEKQPTRS